MDEVFTVYDYARLEQGRFLPPPSAKILVSQPIVNRSSHIIHLTLISPSKGRSIVRTLIFRCWV